MDRMCADWDFSLRAVEGKGEGMMSRGGEKVREESGVKAEGVSIVERGVSRCDILPWWSLREGTFNFGFVWRVLGSP
jgi:hypothetical protein